MGYELVIFDVDGTLVDSFNFFVRHFNVVAMRYDLKPIRDESHVSQLRQLSTREIMQLLGVPLWKLPRVAQAFMTLMADHMEQFQLFSGIESLILNLSERGVRLALASSNHYENIVRVLGAELVGHVEVIESGMSMFGKSARLHRIVRQCGIEPCQAIYIGDQTTDAQAAKSSGIDFGAVAWGYHDILCLQKYAPNYVFDSVDMMADVLLRLTVSAEER